MIVALTPLFSTERPESIIKKLTIAASVVATVLFLVFVLVRRSKKRSQRYVATPGDFVKPKLRKAQEHMASVQPRKYGKDLFPIYGTTPDELAVTFGTGIALYFQFLRVMMLCFGVMFILSLPNLVRN